MQACASASREEWQRQGSERWGARGAGERPSIYRGSSVAAWGLGLLVESIGAHMVRCLPCRLTSRAAMKQPKQAHCDHNHIVTHIEHEFV